MIKFRILSGLLGIPNTTYVYYLYLRHEGRSEVLQKRPPQVVQFAAIHSVFHDAGIVVPTVPLQVVKFAPLPKE